MGNMIMVRVAVIIFAFILAPASVFSQVEQAMSDVQTVTDPAMEAIPPQSDEISIYGEVIAVDVNSGVISVQYYDYDSDEERTADIIINETTTVDNGLSISDIASGDWVDVIYTIKDPKNIAKSIIVEKEEEMPVVEEAVVQVEE